MRLAPHDAPIRDKLWKEAAVEDIADGGGDETDIGKSSATEGEGERSPLPGSVG